MALLYKFKIQNIANLIILIIESYVFEFIVYYIKNELKILLYFYEEATDFALKMKEK